MKGIISSILMLLFSACGYSQESPLRIGTLYFNPPFEQIFQGKKYFGFDIDILFSVCLVMKRECELVPMRFDKLLVALNKNKIDAMIVGISLMPEDPKNYLFSYPYFKSEAVFLTLQSNHLETLNNKTVGMVKNTLFPMAKNYEIVLTGKDALPPLNKFEINFKFYNNLPELLTALDNHEIDALILDAGAANFWITQTGDKYEQIGPVVHVENGMAIMTTKANGELIQQINKALLTIANNNDLLEIYQKYWQLISPDERPSAYLVMQSQLEQ
ncbi:glutamine ABC transporter [Legionella lansingensis]|uniref:Glutamine ABC transporter n=1 Tax=Legionella lansingensis TaxID=45067 RepID=A0A0W0VW62_9GAMM|nr:transporter substrate-binding domain-containing protein [Legionella lansingensis]KTD24293.1 glutamine ABC transporter [Legionella lansingensis]SNV51879.1 glutamine ABC transporter [Legionella lansingensis]